MNKVRKLIDERQRETKKERENKRGKGLGKWLTLYE